MKILSNVVGNFNNEKNFPHKLLLTNTQVLKLCKASANNSSVNRKLSKTQFHKIGQSGLYLGRILGPLLKTGLPLMKNVLKPLAKSVLIPLGLTAAASVTDTTTHKKMFGSGTTALIISNEAMINIMKIVKSPEKSSSLIKGVSETIKYEAKKQKDRFVSISLGTLGANLLGNLLASKSTNRAGKDTIRAGQDF